MISPSRHVYRQRQEKCMHGTVRNALKLFLDQHGASLWSCDNPLQDVNYTDTQIQLKAEGERALFTQ
jgi:hypothetical protein